MKKNIRGGFTLIELLVVIAIIALLSSVVLASLNSARNKGADAAVKSNFNTILKQISIVFDNNNGSYSSVCADSTVKKAISAAASAKGLTWNSVTDNVANSVVCTNAAGTFVVSVKMSTGVFLCLDNTRGAPITDGSSSLMMSICP